MSLEYGTLDLFDLISERHNMVRKVLGERWSEMSDVSISNSEWYIMAKIYKNQPTISSITKSVQITRQATHKFIKKLEEKGLVNVLNANNKRDKCIELTELGERCVEKYNFIKKELEVKISNHIGEKQFETLKELLGKEWGM
ncbi:MarR family winged helix-turn-helix transcriptional regulator [Lysinibacillus endophyticus]|uniref:MarR family winged helix-turn-helix transcriptional regulator n=1 Tax=Ureibacillus endophyticus TaxID=1978490 RepID=UPI00209EFC1A|nr:MarR family winged helix-turn-helix transcriptional regulator [Lysinibacillus endophyticus]MCP1145528.1 MarR family winged helix-turn-helix transcriptional regulator [Lysinibacillus endophyticus]